jgi:hypothetical protein
MTKAFTWPWKMRLEEEPGDIPKPPSRRA